MVFEPVPSKDKARRDQGSGISESRLQDAVERLLYNMTHLHKVNVDSIHIPDDNSPMATASWWRWII